jgi:ankyrin repeat protein
MHTQALIDTAFPNVIADIIKAYFASKGTSDHRIAKAGNYEACAFINYADDGLQGACAGGHMKIVRLMLSFGATRYDMGLGAAWSHGHTKIADMMQLLLEADERLSWSIPLRSACRIGDRAKIDLCLKHNPDREYGLIGAMRGGHMDIVSEMLPHVANPEPSNYVGVCVKGGNRDIIKMLIEKDPSMISDVLSYAYLRSDDAMIDFVEAKYCPAYNGGLAAACLAGNERHVDRMIARGAVNFADGLIGACHNDRPIIAKKFLDHTTDHIGCIYACCSGHAVDTVRLFIPTASNDTLRRGIDRALIMNSIDIATILLSALKERLTKKSRELPPYADIKAKWKTDPSTNQAKDHLPV